MIAEWALALMVLLVPSAKWEATFPATAAAIAEASEADPLWPGDDGVARTAALLLAFGYTESRYRPDAVDPPRRGFGLFQISPQWGPRADLLDPAKAAPLAIRLLRISMEKCVKRPEAERWAWYTDGGATCPAAGYRRSAYRHGIAARLLMDFPPDGD